MKPLLTICLTAAAAAALSACAADQSAEAAPPTGRSCFRPGDVDNWRTADEKSATFMVSRKETWRAGLVGFCSDLNFSEHISLQPRGASSWICTGDDARLVIPSRTGGGGFCDAVDFKKLTPAEMAAAKADKR